MKKNLNYREIVFKLALLVRIYTYEEVMSIFQSVTGFGKGYCQTMITLFRKSGYLTVSRKMWKFEGFVSPEKLEEIVEKTRNIHYEYSKRYFNNLREKAALGERKYLHTLEDDDKWIEETIHQNFWKELTDEQFYRACYEIAKNHGLIQD